MLRVDSTLGLIEISTCQLALSSCKRLDLVSFWDSHLNFDFVSYWDSEGSRLCGYLKC